LVNACIDIDTQMPFYPEFATNNTYGIQAINETAYESAMSALPICQNLTTTCRTMADELDPEDQGTNAEVNKACSDAYLYCFDKVSGPFQATGVSSNTIPDTGVTASDHCLAVPIRHYDLGAWIIPSEVGSWLPEH
jgi:hypothetical protein